MKRIAFSALVAGALSITAPTTWGEPITYSATMTGPAEAPPNSSPGTGTATVIFDAEADTMRVMATFSGLLGTTTLAHIHCCTAVPFTGTVSPATQLPSFVGFPLGVTAGTYDNTFETDVLSTWNPAFVPGFPEDPDLAGAEAAFAAGLDTGRAYFNIHTTEFPGGEIRGFLTRVTAVPEPTTLALLGAALLGLWRAVRRAPARN